MQTSFRVVLSAAYISSASNYFERQLAAAATVMLPVFVRCRHRLFSFLGHHNDETSSGLTCVHKQIQFPAAVFGCAVH